jgi:uncharacterized protein
MENRTSLRSLSPQVLLRGTFVHLPGVGPRTEEGLWRQGITSWRDFLATPKVVGMSPKRKSTLDRELLAAEEELSGGHHPRLVGRFPYSELWRLYPLLEPGARFLDIETEGLSRDCATTVVGISRPGEDPRTIVHRSLVRGMDLSRDNLVKALEGATVLVTFNGSTFDLPVLRREFGDFLPKAPHIDLRHLARRAGLTGGLKSLERRLGIARDPEVQMLAGDDAVRLWRVWSSKGHKRALELLVDYNKEDVKNLAPLASILYRIMGMRHLTKIRSVAGQGPAPKQAGPKVLVRPEGTAGSVQAHLLQEGHAPGPA